jgi:hypothetical protein
MSRRLHGEDGTGISEALSTQPYHCFPFSPKNNSALHFPAKEEDKDLCQGSLSPAVINNAIVFVNKENFQGYFIVSLFHCCQIHRGSSQPTLELSLSATHAILRFALRLQV